MLQELPVGDWFCCSDCERINFAVKKLIEEGEQKLPDYLIDVVKKKLVEKGSWEADLAVSWRVLHGGKSCLDEIRTLLAKAVSVFHVSCLLFCLFSCPLSVFSTFDRPM